MNTLLNRRKPKVVVIKKARPSWFEKKIIPQWVMVSLFLFFCTFILCLTIKGLPGNPNVSDLTTKTWRDNGPFELSPERGRFTLLYSFIEDQSFSFRPELARFSVPDVAYLDGKYVSLFASGLSFAVIPGYLLGKSMGIAQVGTFAMISLFALGNVLFLYLIAVRLGAHKIAALFAGFIFLFATPAFNYAGTLYQHHLSTLLLLAAFYLFIRWNNALSLFAIWFLCALSLSIDYPNLFLMAPIGIAALGRTIIVQREEIMTRIKLPGIRLLAFGGIIFPLLFFFWINTVSYGNPLQLAGGLLQVSDVAPDGNPLFNINGKLYPLQKSLKMIGFEEKQNVFSFFQSRNIMNGLYIHFFSADRGMLYFTPIIFLGFVGIIIAVRKKMPYTALLSSVIGILILLYSMWGDPWGGWGFGSRYLIPAYAVLSLFVAFTLTTLRKYNLFLLFFFVLLSYSVAVNTAGALTSSANPPKNEAIMLEQKYKIKEEYTFVRNIDHLLAGSSQSFIYQTYASSAISAWDYYTDVLLLLLFIPALLLTLLKIVIKKEEQRKEQVYVI